MMAKIRSIEAVMDHNLYVMALISLELLSPLEKAGSFEGTKMLLRITKRLAIEVFMTDIIASLNVVVFHSYRGHFKTGVVLGIANFFTFGLALSMVPLGGVIVSPLVVGSSAFYEAFRPLWLWVKRTVGRKKKFRIADDDRNFMLATAVNIKNTILKYSFHNNSKL